MPTSTHPAAASSSMSRQLPPFVHRGGRAPSSVSAAGPPGAGGAGAALHMRSSATPTPANSYYHPSHVEQRRYHPLQQAFYSDDILPNGNGDDGSGIVRSSSSADVRHAAAAGGGGSRDMPPPPRHASASAPSMHRLLAHTPHYDPRHGSRAPSEIPGQHLDSHDHPGLRQAEPEEQAAEGSNAILVLQCKECQVIVGDSASWVDLIEPLDLLILSAAAEFLRTDGDEDAAADANADPNQGTSASTRAESSIAAAVTGRRGRAAALHTSPSDAPDANSAWHILYCRCGSEIGRKYVTTPNPQLDTLRGNFSFSLKQIDTYQVGCWIQGAGPNAHPDAARSSYRALAGHGGMHAADGGQHLSNVVSDFHRFQDDMNKMRLMLISMGERLLRVEDRSQIRPPSVFGRPDTPSAYPSGSTPAPAGSSPMSYHLPIAAARGGKRVPNAQDAFLPPRVVPRTTATPAPAHASGPSVPDSVEASHRIGAPPSSSTQSSSSAASALHHSMSGVATPAGLYAHTAHQARWDPQSSRTGDVGGPVAPNTNSSMDNRGRQQDSSPYSSPLTPTPAPAPSASQASAVDRNSGTSRPVQGGPSALQTRQSQATTIVATPAASASPYKRGIAQAAAGKRVGTRNGDKAEVAEGEEEEEDEFDKIVATPGSSSASPSKRRKREHPTSGQGSAPSVASASTATARDFGSPTTGVLASRSSRKGGGRTSLPTGSSTTALTPGPSEPRNRPRHSTGGTKKMKQAATRTAAADGSAHEMFADMDDEDDELAIGADARMDPASDDDKEPDRDKGTKDGKGDRPRGRTSTGDGTGGASVVGNSASKALDERKTMPPPPVPLPSASPSSGSLRTGGGGGGGAPRSAKKTVTVA